MHLIHHTNDITGSTVGRLCLHGGAQRGLTLIELMISMTLALLVTLAALGVLLFSRQGNTGMEQSAALRDNSRFGSELIRRVVQQAGFESFNENTVTREGVSGFVTPSDVPDIEGFNNALVAANTNPTSITNGNRTAGCGTVTDTSCVNGSDVLIIRFQGLSKWSASGPVPQGSMINCAGLPVGDATTANLRPLSSFHIRRSAAGEPTLTCTYLDDTGSPVDRELIEGVESFQVLYGVDGVTPGVATAGSAPEPTMINRYLRADQMTVAGNAAATQSNWRRVRAIRIGMIIRGPVGSAIDRTTAQVLYPLGEKLKSTDDSFSTFTAPTDGRLRQEVTFTVHLRNYQGV